MVEIQHKVNTPLRYALMCNSNALQKWQLDCLNALHELNYVEPVLLILPATEETKKTSFISKYIHYPYSKLFYRIYKRFKKNTNQVSSPLPQYLQHIQTLTCNIIVKGKYSQYFSDDDVNTIKQHKLDFIVRFGFNIIRGEILNAALYGVWSYHHGNEQEYRGGPPAFWETYHKKPTMGAILQRLTNTLDAGIVLKKGIFNVTTHSANETLDTAYKLSSTWLKQVCVDIHNNQAHYFNQQPAETKARIYTFPKNGAMTLYGFKRFFRKIRFHFNELMSPEDWTVGIVNLGSEHFLTKPLPNTLQWLNCPNKNSYYADPFLSTANNITYALVEEYNYQTQKGIITAFDVNNPSKPFTLIEEKHHLSYPFVLQHENKTYVLPESASVSCLTLYEVNLAEHKIQNRYTLLENIALYDPTLVQYKGRWWLFATEKTDSNTCLSIYHSQHLTGPYIAHANNFVKTNITNSRPAGSLFIHEGILYRPTQNSTYTYGGSVAIQKITELNETAFEEETVNEIYPLKSFSYNKGVHTINSNGTLAIVDAKKFRFNGANFKNKLRKKFKMNR